MDELNNKISAVILAAGKGTRMKSRKAKVLHEIFFKSMINHVVDAVLPLNLNEIIIVTGHEGDAVEEHLAGYNLKFTRQKNQIGTGDAVKSAEKVLSTESEMVLILCGDTPIITTKTLQQMISLHSVSSSMLTVMTTILEKPDNYGRIISDSRNNILRIVEEKDASPEERQIKEVNTGIYIVEKSLLFSSLKRVDNDNIQGEIYLTDIVGVAHKTGVMVHKFVCPDPMETMGVNSRLELSEAGERLQKFRNLELMENGVSIETPSTTFIDPKVKIGVDSIISSNVYISGKSILGKNCFVQPFCKIHDCIIGDGVTINSFSDLNGKKIV